MPARADIVAAFRLQAEKCLEMGSPFTADLLALVAEELQQDGAVTALIGDWSGDPISDALPLRVAGVLHAVVLEGGDAELAAAYPAPDRAGRPEKAWAAAARLIADRPEAVARRLTSPPQTNETGRALGLYPGLLVLAGRFAQPMALLELGASAGLNLNMDAFGYRTAAWSREGDCAVVIEGDWRGPPPPRTEPRVIARAGCDQNPLDPSDAADRLRLRAYVWADQFERLARLEAAMDLAAARGVNVERADAADWIRARLATRPLGALTVVYHSVFQQYPPQATREAIEATIRREGERATGDAPLAWLRFEPEQIMGGARGAGRFWVTLETWPGGGEERLAEVDPHGRWVAWLG